MNHDIEDILKRQPLRKPRPALDDRVLSALRADADGEVRKTDSSVGWRVVVGWGLATAAAVAVVAFVLHRGQGSAAPTPVTVTSPAGLARTETAPAVPRVPAVAGSAQQLPAPERLTVAVAGTSVQPSGTGTGARVNAGLQAGATPRTAPGLAVGPARDAAVTAGVRSHAVVETTWSEWGAGSVLVLNGNLPVQPVVHRTVRYTRWTDTERNRRFERREPASQVFLVRAPVI